MSTNLGEIFTGAPLRTFDQDPQARYRRLNSFLSRRNIKPVTPEIDPGASKFQQFRQGLKQNNEDRIAKGFLSGDKGAKIVTNFMFYMLMAMALADVTLFIDMYVTDYSTIMGVHTIRILVFVSMIIMAILSFSQGWRIGTVRSWYDVLTRLITLVIAVVYTVLFGLQFKDPNKKTLFEIGRLSVVCIMSVYLIVMLVWGIIHWTRYEYAEITMTSIVFWSVIGIALSGFSMYGAANPGDEENTDVPIPE